MAQDRIKCPFCSEQILRDAIKCRFCGEWFSEPEQDMDTDGSIEDSNHAVDDQEQDRVSVVDKQQHILPIEAVQNSDSEIRKADESSGDEQSKHVIGVEKSSLRVAREVIPGEGLDAGLIINGHKIPWLRILLIIFYLGIVAVLIISELSARTKLHDAWTKETNQEYNEAFTAYRGIIDTFPFSFALIETRQGLLRISQSQKLELPRPSWLSKVEKLFGKNVNLPNVYLLPFVAWPVSALLLLLVFLTRILRHRVAILALLLMLVAIAGSVAQFAWYGLISLVPVAEAAQDFMQTPATVYYASYFLLAMTVLMTLTASTKRISPHMIKMAVNKTMNR